MWKARKKCVMNSRTRDNMGYIVQSIKYDRNVLMVLRDTIIEGLILITYMTDHFIGRFAKWTLCESQPNAKWMKCDKKPNLKSLLVQLGPCFLCQRLRIDSPRPKLVCVHIIVGFAAVCLFVLFYQLFY